MNDDFDLNLINKYIPDNEKNNAIKKLKSGYPIQYIIGNVDFYDTIISVNENVLIPRFETEYLVDYIIKLYQNQNKILNILDIGTGSGCISIALKKNLACNVLGIDISPKAIELAKKNALDNDVIINFNVCDIKDFSSSCKYDIIVSNPPYVPYDAEVDPKTRYEPQNAIFAKDNGLYFYKLILDKCEKLINKNGLIAFEIGDKQGTEIMNYAKKYFPTAKITILKDLNNYERYLFIKIE